MPSLREAYLRHAEHYKNVAAAGDLLYLESGEAVKRGLALFDAERGNIEMGQGWAMTHTADDEAAARLCSDYPDQAAYCLVLRLHARERIRWREAALGAARGLKDRRAEGHHLDNLGVAYADLGEPGRAIEYHEQCLAIARETGDRRGEGNALGNLGNAYQNLGEPLRAIEYYQHYLANAREMGDRRGEGVALGNLGIAYGALGEPGRAIEYYEQALVIKRAIGERRGEGNSLWNMSLDLDKLGDRAQAIAHGEAALGVFEQIEHPSAARVRKQLAEWRRG
jgi:tetratricopeptide (TPR) repeat protein